jgi:3-methyladenine DNA glycosylase AlkD
MMNFTNDIKKLFYAYADKEKAIGMKAYMRNQFEYLGLTTPLRKEFVHPLIKELNPSCDDLFKIAQELYLLPEREFQYTAITLLNHYWTKIEDIQDLENIIVQKPWWDTIDSIVGTYGHLVKRQPELTKEMDRYSVSDNFWLRRISLIYQLGYKKETNQAKLFEYCLLMADEKEFFIRKAIGWSLRQYARVEPEKVKEFVSKNKLSTLSTREALKRLT